MDQSTSIERRACASIQRLETRVRDSCSPEPVGVPELERAKQLAEEGRWLAALAVADAGTLGAEDAGVQAEQSEDQWSLENTRLRLFLCLAEETVYGVLMDKTSGRIFAEGPYIYYLERQEQRRRIVTETIEPLGVEICSLQNGEKQLELTGSIGRLRISHRFRLGPENSYFEEQITLRNDGDNSANIPKIAFGFTYPVTSPDGHMLGQARDDRWVAVPYRRDNYGRSGEYEDYSVAELLSRRGWYRTVPSEAARFPAEEFGSEGWVCVTGEGSLLVAKHSQEQMEFSLLGIERLETGVHLRFGGCGIWHGDPEHLADVKPGDEINFGVTRYQLVDGGWKEGYYAFREFMNGCGHGLSPGFDPPVHWNELYDNRLWWGSGKSGDTKENREKYYQLRDMKEEAQKAQEIGCESLYLDPGWDTSFASCIWDEGRLGTPESFVRRMADEYGLKVSLHCPLAGWCDAEAYPREADRLDKDGKRLRLSLCGGSQAYLDAKVERLLRLCEAGVVFLMYDGTRYTGPCYDETHGHPIPYTREAHCRAYLDLARRIHRKYPHVLIEMHDMIVGGVILRYCPTYYLHGLEGSYDLNWGFEYMWDPMEDLLSGRGMSLYYYNLAYELPIYLHIDLRMDNIHCLEFWWYASTCRHLGIGGRHSDPAVWEAHKRAMSRYMRLKEFYTQGKFYGLAENIHLHVLPEKKAAVVNLFNFEDREVVIQDQIDLEGIGIGGEIIINREDSRWRQSGSKVTFSRRMAPRSAAVLEIRPR